VSDGARRIPVSAPDLGSREREYVLECVDSTWISSKGEYIGRFEAAFREFSGAAHAIATNNGTTALHLALVALGIGPGDEVLVPTLTYIASANAVRYCGATPVFVDADATTWNIDPDDARQRVTSRTKAIMPVHLFGQPADLSAISVLAAEYGLRVVEDAAEAHGATLNERVVGALGDIGTFSFYGNKIITTGEGGMVVTNDAELAQRALMLRGQGQSFERTYWFPVVGFNYRMTNIQAAIGLAQLETVEKKLARRREIAARYRAALPFLTFQGTPPGTRSAEWMVSVVLPVDGEAERDELARILAADGIETRPFFYPVHTMPPYADSQPELPVATEIAARGLCLPTYGTLSDDDIDYVADRLRAAIGINEEVRVLRSGDGAALTEFFTAIAADAETIRHFHPHPWDAKTAHRIASGNGRDVYLGLFAGSWLVGYAMLRGWDEGYERPSFGVAVHPHFRGRGAGSRLLAAALEIARERGSPVVMLKVHRDNARAFDWYHAAGFRTIGETDDDQWVCELRLDSEAPA
jgi:perosamine synthetase